MNPLRTVLVAAVALAFPLGLALAVYASSAGTLDTSPAAVSAPAETLGRPSTEPPTTTSGAEDDGRGRGRGRGRGGDDDRCDERENRDDPECVAAEDDDSSGRGRGRGRGRGGDD